MGSAREAAVPAPGPGGAACGTVCGTQAVHGCPRHSHAPPSRAEEDRRQTFAGGGEEHC